DQEDQTACRNGRAFHRSSPVCRGRSRGSLFPSCQDHELPRAAPLRAAGERSLHCRVFGWAGKPHSFAASGLAFASAVLAPGRTHHPEAVLKMFPSFVKNRVRVLGSMQPGIILSGYPGARQPSRPGWGVTMPDVEYTVENLCGFLIRSRIVGPDEV